MGKSYNQRVLGSFVLGLVVLLVTISTSFGSTNAAIGDVTVIYDDTLAANWAETGFARTYLPSQTGTVHAGTNAIETTIDAGGIVYLNYNSGGAFPDANINTVRFWIHGGAGGDTLKFSVMPASYDFDSHFINLTLAAGWQQVTVPYSQFGTVAQVTGIAWKNTGSSTSETLYIDEIEFVEAAVPTDTPTPTATVGNTSTPTPTATGVPTGTAIIYDDALAANWEEAGFSRTYNPDQTGTVHSGTKAIETTIDAGGLVYLNYSSGASYPDSSINVVRFWIHGGVGGDVLKFSIMPAAYDFDSHFINITLAAGWQQVEVPFSQIGTVSQVTGIAWKNTGSSTSETIYIDDIAFGNDAPATPTPTATPPPGSTSTPAPTATSVPTGTTIIYDDTLAVDWAVEGFNRALDLNQTSVVHSGTQAISTTIQSGGIVYLNYASGSVYPDSSINTIRFWVHGGTTGGQTVKFSILPVAYDFDTYSTNIGPLTTGWQQIEIPFTQFSGLTQVTGIAWTNTGGSTLDSFYIDDIEFANVPGNSPTATPTPSGNSTATPTPVPSGVSVIYDDALATNWAEAGFSRTYDPNQTGTVHSGAKAIETVIDAGGIVYLDYSSGSAYPNSTINSVRFWIHGGTGGDVLKFSVLPAAYDFDTHAINITLIAGWQQVNVPFSQFGTVAQVTGIAWKNTGSNTSQTLYIDEIEFYEGIIPTPTPTNTPTPMGPTPFPTLDPGAPTSNDTYRLTLSIDRSSVPTLFYNDLTLKTYVGQATEVIVQGDGIVIPSTYSESTGYVQYSTEASSVVIDVVGGVDVPWLGTTQKMVIKDGKSWAWSHGFDDNVFLFPAIDLFEAKGWRGSIYLIGDTIDDTRDENWIVDAPAAQRLLAGGWSLGSHGWNNSCTDYNQPQMEQGINRIEDVVSTSLVPDYKVIAYAAPCLISDYHPIVLNMRDTQVNDMLFNESGNNYLQVIDPDGAEFTVGDNTAVAFNIDEPIGRDISVETESLATMEGIVDWVSTNSNSGQHVWYNTLSHGGQEEKLAPFIDYVYNNYGPAGTDEVWVAPADEIYSYILVRDETVVALDQITLVQGPTPTPTTIPTQIPTPTPTLAPTQTPTATPVLPPTATPTPGPAPAWTQVTTTTQPDVIAGYAMTYDTARNVTILYGGGRAWPYSNETWEFNGTSWNQVATTAEPNARYGMTLIYDGVRNKTFLFGGSDEQDKELNETWELVGGTWLQILPANGLPSERTGHAAIWNSDSNQIMIHGGNKSDTTLDDLWTFDGSSWVEITTTNQPSPRTEHTLAYSGGELLLYGGRSNDGTLLGETAILNLATLAWTISSGSDPGARQKHTLVYWPDRGIFVLAGGTASASQSYSRLAWEHTSAGSWNSLADGPTIMSSYPAVGIYDASDQSIVVFVGTETWVLK